MIADFAVGVPRGRNLQGKVVLYRQNLSTIDIIRGEQVSWWLGLVYVQTFVVGNMASVKWKAWPLF